MAVNRTHTHLLTMKGWDALAAYLHTQPGRWALCFIASSPYAARNAALSRDLEIQRRKQGERYLIYLRAKPDAQETAAPMAHTVTWLGEGEDPPDYRVAGIGRPELLRQNPGQWMHLGTKKYRGGFGDYRRQGFKHIIRKAADGYDHYLCWPVESA